MSVDWENLHKIGRRPWDLLGVTPMLKFFCESDHKGKVIIEELKANARILIPGCGQIHDAEYLGKLLPNSQITALDISKSAVESCKASIGAQTTNVEFVLGDFFDEEDYGFSSGFDLIYDHTFLCALTPQLRPDWARRIKQLARKYLLTVEFPLAEEWEEVDLSDGPPFQLSHSIYHELLDDKFQLIHKWDRTFVPTSNEKRRGREQLSLWIKN